MFQCVECLRIWILQLIKWVALVFQMAFVLPFAANGQTLTGPFLEAIEAVENRDYASFEAILELHPRLVDFTNGSDCSLICEFSRLLREPIDGESTSEIDERAIQMVLDSGGDPTKSPHALGDLLTSANFFLGDISEFPVNSNRCIKNRNELFPIINRMILAGASLEVLQKNSINLAFTVGFFYSYQLCHSPYICGADYEEASPQVAARVSSAISVSERNVLMNLVDEQALMFDCVNALDLYQEK